MATLRQASLALLLALGGTALLGQGTSELGLTLRVNDAFVKDRALEGVASRVFEPGGSDPIREGNTDEQGSLALRLPAGDYSLELEKTMYVPMRSDFTVHSEGQVLTISLSMLLEAEGSAAGRIRIVLNWGSNEAQVKDADSHLLCACLERGAHVYFMNRDHEGAGHSANLDVDDMDWGGPETITLLDPPAGRYQYWVHNFSGEPARLGDADVVVRVFFDDEMVAELPAPSDAAGDEWRPFEEIVVSPGQSPRLVPFRPEQLARAVDRYSPAIPETAQEEDEDLLLGCFTSLATWVLVPLLVVFVIRKVIRGRKSR